MVHHFVQEVIDSRVAGSKKREGRMGVVKKDNASIWKQINFKQEQCMGYNKKMDL